MSTDAAEVVRPCPACGEPTAVGSTFCEACGHELPVDAVETPTAMTEPCVACGVAEGQIVDGYCMECGHKQPAPRDHIRIDLGWVAGVSDRGRRHRHNEDSMGLEVIGATAIIVVCDGVSSTDMSDVASQAAVDAAMATLVDAVSTRTSTDDGAAVADAATAAQAAVVAAPPADEQSGSCTFVAAIARDSGDGVAVTVGWLGDSRAYWVGADAELLTVDHSWANEMVAAGVLGEVDAAAHPHAHTITRWIGPDAPDVAPDIVTSIRPRGGSLLVCSDGLWNYAPDPQALADLPGWDEPTVIDRAVALTQFANDSGGHDNITTVIASFAGDAEAADVLDSPVAAGVPVPPDPADPSEEQ